MVGDRRSGSAPEDARLSAIVVGYRQPGLVHRAVDALESGSRRPDQIIVVDVDPVDPIAARSGFSVVTVDDNPGYAAACMRGAADADGDWLVFLNADVTVSPGALSRTLQAGLADETIAIVTCRLELPDGSLDHACHRGIPSVFDSLSYKVGLDRLGVARRRLGHYRMTWLDPSTSHEVEACTGAFLMIRRDAFEAVGGWDTTYRFYAEDLDLCLRVRQAGWRVWYAAEATATHAKGSASHLQQDPASLSSDDLATRRWVREAVLESHERFYEQHLEPTTSPLLRPLVRAQFAWQRRRLERERG